MVVPETDLEESVDAQDEDRPTGRLVPCQGTQGVDRIGDTSSLDLEGAYLEAVAVLDGET